MGFNSGFKGLNLSLKCHLNADTVFKKNFFLEDKCADGEDFDIIHSLLQTVRAKSNTAPNKPALTSSQNAKSNWF